MDIKHTIQEDIDPFAGIVSNTAYALRATVSQASPAQLIFQRDMIMHATYTTNCLDIHRKQRIRQEADNRRENRHRIRHTYNIGGLILIRNDDIRGKLTTPTFGPYTITNVIIASVRSYLAYAMGENVVQYTLLDLFSFFHSLYLIFMSTIPFLC